MTARTSRQAVPEAWRRTLAELVAASYVAKVARENHVSIYTIETAMSGGFLTARGRESIERLVHRATSPSPTVKP